MKLVDLVSLWQVVKPESMESGPIKCPGGRFKKKAQRTTAYKVRSYTLLIMLQRSWVIHNSDYLLSSATYIIKFVALLSSVVLQRKKMWPEASKSARSDKDDNLVPMVRP
jgi:hypothetical protein